MVTASAQSRSRSPRPTGKALLRTVLRAPFTGETWRRTAYVLIALPVGVFCVPLALLGSRAAGRIQRGQARRLLGVDVPEPDRASKPLALAHALLTLPLHLIAAVVTGYFWFVVLINLGYPLRPDNDYAQSWGGPTLAGAWAVHAVGGGIGFLLLTPWAVKAFTALQARLVRAFHGASRERLLSSAALALAVAAACALLSIPVIHQFS